MCVLLPFIVGVEGEDPAEFTKRPDVFGWAWDYEPTFDSSGVYPFEKAVFVQGSSLLLLNVSTQALTLNY